MSRYLLVLFALLLFAGCSLTQEKDDPNRTPLCDRIDGYAGASHPEDARNGLRAFGRREGLTAFEQAYLIDKTFGATILSSTHKADILEALAGNKSLTPEAWDLIYSNTGKIGVRPDMHRVQEALEANPR